MREVISLRTQVAGESCIVFDHEQGKETEINGLRCKGATEDMKRTGEVRLVATSRGVVYGAQRRSRGVSQATFRDLLGILRFTNGRFQFCVRLSLN